jgi:LysR family transcriptional regulator, transcriptional activator of the cysJI operon
MDDRLLKFARLVEIGSFTRAAEELHISQPALTLAISKLERELKTPLLIRTKRKLELTDAGRLVYVAATQHWVANENLMTSLAELRQERPKAVIGMIDSIAAAFSATVQPLDDLERAADVSIVVNNSRYLREAVKGGDLNLAFVVQDSSVHTGLDIEPVGVEPLVVVCRSDLLAAVQAELDQGKLSHFICYDQLSNSYRHINKKLQEIGLAVQPTFYSTSPDVMLRMVLRGTHVAALPYLLTRELLNNGTLTALQKDGHLITIERPISVAKVHGKILPKALETFSEQAKITLDSIRQESESLKLSL